MGRRQKHSKRPGKAEQVNHAKQSKEKKRVILSRFSEKERELYERLRAALVPNNYGIAASVLKHPVTKLWQGWISDGNVLIFTSARKDIDQAYADVEKLLALSERDDFGFEDAVSLWGKAKAEDDFPPEPLPEYVSKGLLCLIRLIYEIDEKALY